MSTSTYNIYALTGTDRDDVTFAATLLSRTGPATAVVQPVVASTTVTGTNPTAVAGTVTATDGTTTTTYTMKKSVTVEGAAGFILTGCFSQPYLFTKRTLTGGSGYQLTDLGTTSMPIT